MPDFLSSLDVDWDWEHLLEHEQTVVRHYEALLQADPTSQTLRTFCGLLAAVTTELPGREVRARATDAHGEYELSARAGDVTQGPGGGFNPLGRYRGPPPTVGLQRLVGVERMKVALFWPMPLLQQLEAWATKADASISWVVQKGWLAGRDVQGPLEALVTDELQKLSVFMPIEMAADVARVATETDKSRSWVVQRAIRHAAAQLDDLTATAALGR